MTKQMDAHEQFQELIQRLMGYGIHAYFLLLLALSRSRTHLRELHDSLPENCRLMRDDFIVLEKAWGLRFAGEPEPGSLDYVLDHGRALWMLDRSREYTILMSDPRSADLTRYYYNRVVQAGTTLAGFNGELADRSRLNSTVLPHPSCGRSPHFLAKLCGRELDCRITASLETGAVGVCFDVWERELTEPLAYQLTKLPPWLQWVRSSSSDRGSLIDITYVVNDADGSLANRLEKTVRFPGDPNQTLTADRAFLNKLVRLLKAKDVPVETIVPVLNFEDGKPGDWICWDDWRRHEVVAAFNEESPRKIDGLTAKLNDAGMTTLHLAVRPGMSDEEIAEDVMLYFEIRNPRLQRADLTIGNILPCSPDNFGIIPSVLYFVSPEGVCHGAPHSAIPRDERGKLVWPQPAERTE